MNVAFDLYLTGLMEGIGQEPEWGLLLLLQDRISLECWEVHLIFLDMCPCLKC